MIKRMAPAQKSLFYCPLCKSRLKQDGDRFICLSCQSQYPQKKGIPHLLPSEDNAPSNHFTFAGKDIPRLAKKIKTPFYLFSEKIIEENFRKLKTSFSQNGKIPLKIYYSAKTNYEPAVLKTLKTLGSGIEVAWGAELSLAQRLGFEKEKICFDGPVKTEKDLKGAIKSGIKLNADSFVEVEKISQIASNLKRTALIGFRINPDLEGILLNLAFQLSKL
jgi:diaminopimelate decarboxylase